jgi:hypothetical protein
MATSSHASSSSAAGTGTAGAGMTGANAGTGGRATSSATPPAQAGTGGAAAGAAGSSAQSPQSSGGLVAKQAPPDPKITFDWMETPPGGQGTDDCKAGTYTGSFTCTYQLDPNDPSTAMDISGPVVFTLTKSQNGEFLEISNGTLHGLAADVFDFTSELSGMLDCSTNAFDASAQNGMYGFGDVNALPVGTFTGMLSGMLDPASATLMGTWSLTASEVGITCTGPWTAMFTP